MTTWSVLLVDPNGARRGPLARELQQWADVRVVATPADAKAAAAERRPDAVALSLRQIEGHGLKLGKDLQALAPEAWILVYGTDPSLSGKRAELVENRKKIEQKWKISRYEPRELEADAIAAALLAARPRDVAGQGPVSEAHLSRLERRLWWRSLWDALFEHHDLIPVRPRAHGERPGVAEILNGPPTLENVRRLFETLGMRQAA